MDKSKDRLTDLKEQLLKDMQERIVDLETSIKAGDYNAFVQSPSECNACNCPSCCTTSDENKDEDEHYVYIVNTGCDAETYGVARFSAKGLAEFKKAVEELNKNSYYGCMPTITISEISKDDLILIGEEDSVSRFEVEHEYDNDDSIYKFATYPLYMDGKCYWLKDGCVKPPFEIEAVVKEGRI